MSGYGFLRAVRMPAGIGLLVFAGIVICIWCICSEMSTENDFRRRYGEEWRTEYEKTYGSLAEARAKSIASGVGLLAITGVTAWLWRILRRGGHAEANHRRHHRRRKSHLEQIMIYRRNALIGVYFGLPGIFLGALLVIFRCGIFLDHSNEVVLGMFVFLGGYAAIIAGCAYWLKAKEWSEALVVIGLLPLAILFIPFVRLILIAEPTLLPVGMFMMSLILIVAVFALPDKSGAGRPMKSRARAFRKRFGRSDSGVSGEHVGGQRR